MTTDVVSQCRAEWKRLGVSANARADLESELTADLAAAADDRVDASTLVGGDAAAFAREWALARGLARARWHVLGCAVVSGAVGVGSLAAVNLLLRPAWLQPPFDQQHGGAASWLYLYINAAPYLVAPVLLAVGLFLHIVKDSQATRTVVVLLVASPASVWICAEAARWLNGTGGSGRGVLTLGLVLHSRPERLERSSWPCAAGQVVGPVTTWFRPPDRLRHPVCRQPCIYLDGGAFKIHHTPAGSAAPPAGRGRQQPLPPPTGHAGRAPLRPCEARSHQ